MGLLLTVLAVACLSPASIYAPVPPATRPISAIDMPARDRVVPADAVVDGKADYGAVGDGRVDDTAAIQAAISAGLGQGNPDKVVYLPAGIYRLTAPLEWRDPDGKWDTGLTLMGENRDETVLRLDDAAPGFHSAQAPRAVIVTASQNSDGADGSGNQAFHNFIFDLTVDVGSVNAGAVGIDYLANNRGAIRNVVIRAPPDSGHTGVAMNRRWPGPALLKDVRIEGFARGISISRSEYSMTIEDLRLSGQREIGIVNSQNVLSVRRLVSDNAVPAIRNGTDHIDGGLLTVLDSVLVTEDAVGAAIESHGGTFISSTRVRGYVAPIWFGDRYRYFPDGSTWSSTPALSAFPQSAVPPPLPVHEEPRPAEHPLEQWAGVGAFGADPDDGVDDTIAIQAALASGKPVVYLRAGRYEVSESLHVPDSVEAIMGFEATLSAERGVFGDGSGAPVVLVDEPSPVPLVISLVSFIASPGVVNVERTAIRTLAMRHVQFNAVPFHGGPGEVFLTDVAGGPGWRFGPGQLVWARQFNTESADVKVVNDGADLWILGLKTERPSTVVESINGARTEIRGGLLYPVNPVPAGTAAFVTVDSSLSATFTTVAFEPDRTYPVLIEAVRDGERHELSRDEAPRAGFASSVVLVVEDPR